MGIPRVNAYTIDLLKFEVSQRVYSLYSSFLSGSLPGNQVELEHTGEQDLQRVALSLGGQ